MINKSKKKDLISEISNLINSYTSVLSAEYRGIDSNEINTLRRLTREKDIIMCVYRNTLFKRAIRADNLVLKANTSTLNGPLLYFFCNDIICIAKIISSFTNEEEFLKLKLIYSDGKIMSNKSFEEISSISDKDELITRMIFCIKMPLIKLVNSIICVSGKKAKK